MHPAILGIMILIVGMGVGGAIAIVVIITKYLSSRGGGSQEELEQMRAQLALLSQNVENVQETLADMTLMLSDAAEPRLPPADGDG